MRDEKLIFSPQLAKYLLKRGYKICDIKAKRDAENEVVFVFTVEEGFYDVIDEFKRSGN